MAMPLSKVSVGKSGCGAAHATYITRLSALDPDRKWTQNGPHEEQTIPMSFPLHDYESAAEPTVSQTIDEHLSEKSLNKDGSMGAGRASDADPIWTWNAPEFLTGEQHGTKPELVNTTTNRKNQRTERSLPVSPDQSHDKLTLREKIDNIKLYFGSREEFERRKGGRTHYRIILSFDVPATNKQIRELGNRFLREVFPNAVGFGAIHRDTEHPHVHIYLHSRQTDGRRVQLKNSDYRSIDEKWAAIYADFAGDRSVYVEHLRKKEETRQWKIAAARAYHEGKPIPPKPERDNDRRERLAEQRLSAERSRARDKGCLNQARPPAEPLSRPASEKETARLLAREEVAREHLAHLIRTDVPDKEVKMAARTAHELAAALEKTREARKQMGKERMPPVVYTTEEWKHLKEYRASREVPVKDDRAAVRLQCARVLAGAELKDTQFKAEAFQASRHLWKFETEGWDRGPSLKEVEQAIKIKSEERLKLYNFLRPSRREMIANQIVYLQEVKKDIQRQLATKESAMNKDLGAAEIRYDMAAKQVELSKKVRFELGKAMPSPVFHKEELAKMEAIASRTRDGQLLMFVYEQVRDKLLDNPSAQALSRAKGRSVMARLEMLKEADRFLAAARFSDFRQLPRKDEQGLDQTKSVREVSSKNALETIIRHFTDSPERKREARELTDLATQQVKRAEAMSIKAKDYSVAMDRILDDFCRAAGVSAKQVAPALNPEEIAGLRDFSDKLPFLSSARREFIEAAKLAEDRLDKLEAVRASREARSEGLANRPESQSRSEGIPSGQRTDRDTFSRGR